jgi:PAS domain S-box-containing protein
MQWHIRPAVKRSAEWQDDRSLLRAPRAPQEIPAVAAFPTLAALTVAVLSALLLLGWLFGLGPSEGIVPRLGTLKVNSAWGLLLCALSLFLRASPRTGGRRAQAVASLLAIGAILIGAFALYEYATNHPLAFNQYLLPGTPPDELGEHIGLIPLNTGSSLIATGLALLLARRELAPWRDRLMRLFALFPLLFSLLALAEHVMGVESFVGLATYTPMSLQATISFLLLSLGIFFLRRHQGLVRIASSRTTGGSLTRRFLLAAVLLPLVLGLLIPLGWRLDWYTLEFAGAVLITGFVVLFVLFIWLNVRELERIDIARQAAQESRAILDSILHSAPIGFSFVDSDLRIRRMNDVLAKMVGTSVEAAQGRTLEEIAPHLAKTRKPLFEQVLRIGEPVLNHEEEDPSPSKAGVIQHWISSYYPIRDTRGYVIGVSMLHIDVSEQHAHEIERERLLQNEKKAREDLETANARLRALGEATVTLASSLDYETTLRNVARSVVPSVSDFCIIDLLEAEGTVQRVALVAGDSRLDHLLRQCARFPPDPASSSPLARILRTGIPEVIESISDEWLDAVARSPEHREILRQLRPRSAMVVPLEVRQTRLGILNIISTQPGRKYTRHDLLFARELARRAAVAIDNARLYRQAGEAIRARDDMLAIVSHDLRNPLAAIDMSATMIVRQSGEPPDADRTRRYALTIQRSSKRMQFLIKDLLDASALEASTLSMRREAWPAGTLVHEIVDLIEPLAQERRLELVVEAEQLEEVLVDCDRERVLQALSNLLGNALKFTREGGLVFLRVQPGENSVRFEVQDTGPGIRPAELSHLFDRYWKGRGTGALGTGLGLYITRGIIHLHGSELTVESEPGQGARFSFTLPYANAATQAPVVH